MPLPHDIDDICYSAVHRGWLYVISHSKSAGVVVLRTNNKVHWESLPSPVPSSAVSCYCHGMLDYNNRLFILLDGGGQHLYIRELLEINSGIEWHWLPNGCCPVKRHRPAFFGAWSSLVLAGGYTSTKPWPTWCSEYDLHGNDWVTNSRWPTLFRAVAGLQAVTVKNRVYLLGGHDETMTPNTVIFSIPLVDGELLRLQPHWAGATDHAITTPYGDCGACCVHDNVVVVGGNNQNFASCAAMPQPNAFVLNSTIFFPHWLKLPELVVARRYVSLTFFSGSLLAIGGCLSLSFSREVEELSVPSRLS